MLLDGVQSELSGWVLIRIEGRHRERFLHSQLTSDVRSLAVGSSQITALLDRSARLQCYGFLHKRDESFDLLVPMAAAEKAIGALEASIIADDVSIEGVETPSLRLALGAEAVRLEASREAGDWFPVEGWGSRGFVQWDDSPIDLEEISPEALDALGVVTGLPRWDVEIEAGTPIHDTPLIDSAVSFDKGCYLGQETVAKVASGRGAARALVLLETIDPEATIEFGFPGRFSTPEKDRAGEIVSRVHWDETDSFVGRVARELRVEASEHECRFDDSSVHPFRVRGLPVVSTPDPSEWAHRLTVAAAKAFSADREDEAIELLERAIAVDPGCADAYESLGVIHGRQENYEEAIALMERLLEVDPESVMAHTNLSLYHNRLGRIEDAEREAAEAMRAKMQRDNRERDRERSAAGQAEAAATDRRRRSDLFRQVLELDPEDALANFGLGELCVEEGRFDDAVEHLERALASDPAHSAALLALGRAYEGAGDLEAARTSYRTGIGVAAAKGDLKTANHMQERLVVLTTNREA